ncbi:arylsulfatase A-like enzyme [Scopulibacillus darangshiensis]|uniref:Arylsulfatase A-like enzyme n=2 Tax=Scopulibacillus darangshiensis TaxID=442528 RepID=A0A4R2NMZ5_9BACL|nr:arylsulfatase A-like enzyme [Scopulibacillus darangshiensis]
MDRIGREGVSFKRAYCPNTVCTPSRTSMMTGVHLSRHGAYNIGTTAIDKNIFFSHLLRNKGYQTHHIGKAHWYPWGIESPENAIVDEKGTPFKDFTGFEKAELSVGHGTWGVTGHYKRWIESKGFCPSDFKEQYILENDANGTADWELPIELHSGTWIAERAVEFLRNYDNAQSFYLNLGFQDPHHPHVVPKNYQRRIDADDIPLTNRKSYNKGLLPEHITHFHNGTINESRFKGKFAIAGNEGFAWKAYYNDEPKARTTKAYYYTMVQLIDDQLGVILEELDKLGLSDNTLLIFTSDHGEMLGDHSIGQKGPMVYEGVTHIPLLIRYPNGFDPCEVEECVSLVDLAPTILDFLNIEDSIQRDGISLRPRLEKGKPLERDGVRIEYKEEPNRIRFKCWVTQEWKIAIYFGESFGELYDLKNDPNEMNNLFQERGFEGVKTKLLIDLLNDMERSEPLSNRTSRV